MKFSYYPGCSLHSTAKEYDESTRSVCQSLNVELIELVDWNCCGASAAHSLNHELFVGLCGRNILNAQRMELDIVVPCSACYNNLKRANEELKDDSTKREKLEKTLGIPFTNGLQIRHLLDVIYHEVGIEKIQQLVKKPLKNLKLVSYYGCLISRPPEVGDFDSVEQPQSMDRLLEATGAEVMNWSYKTDCCGAGLSLSQAPIVIELVTKIINMAKEAGAECIVTACPMCQANLEMRQIGGNMPIFYFTELLGKALGMPDVQSWFKKHLISGKL